MATSSMQHAEPREADFKFFGVLAGIFVACLIIATVASAKILSIGPFNIPGGTLVFPIVFIFNDVFTETYGFARSRRIIWTGLACQALAAVTFLVVGALPPAPFWPHQEAYEAVLGFAPRVALAGLVAYFTGEFANSVVISKMKYWEKGERGIKQGWRFVASTLVGEAVDSIVFMTVAFLGEIPPTDLLTTMLTLYVIKVIYEVVALPFSTRFANWLKAVEGVDHIDTPGVTSYNPFSVFSK